MWEWEGICGSGWVHAGVDVKMRVCGYMRKWVGKWEWLVYGGVGGYLWEWVGLCVSGWVYVGLDGYIWVDK